MFIKGYTALRIGTILERIKGRYLIKNAGSSVKLILKTIILFCFITPLFSENSVSFSFGSEQHSRQNQYQDITGISLAYMHGLNEAAALGMRFNYSTLSYAVATPSAERTIPVNGYDFYLVYSHAFIPSLFTVDFKTVIGTGVKVLNRESFRIDLGAFGQETSPAKSQTYFSSFISLLLMKKVSSNLKLFVEPGYAFYDAQKLHNVFSIRGGIDVSFN